MIAATGEARRIRKRRGTALVEAAMCIPLLAAVIVLTMFLGWGMMNQQSVKAAARYTSWRRVYGSWNRPDDADPNDPNDSSDIDDPNHPGLNRMFFGDRARSIHVDRSEGPSDEFEQLVAAAFSESDYAGSFADRLIINPLPDYGRFPRARRAQVWAEFASDMAAFQKYQGDIYSHHIRDGVEWRRRQADCRHVTREQFLHTLDTVLRSVRPPGDGMAKMVRSLYLHGW
jgi:hypothetical protein